MTPEELAAIRERDASLSTDPLYGALAVADRHSLLSEVDYLLNRIVTATNVAYVNGLMAERDRIRTAVEGLRAPALVYGNGWNTALDAVLDAINETKESADA